MCKVLIMPKVNGPKAVLFAQLMGIEMSERNTDGLGYAAVDAEGKLFGERWVNNVDGLVEMGVLKWPEPIPNLSKIQESLEQFKEPSSPTKGEYNSFGVNPKMNRAVALTLHTRMATSAKGMNNTHPFVYESADTSLIHNGVINNDKDFKLNVSTCDSEAILIAYLESITNSDPNKARDMAQMLRGYYACGVFSRDGENNRILDVFKGNHASLYAQYIKELETIVFATSDIDVRNVCSKLGLTKSESFRVKEGQLLRFNPINGEHISTTQFFVPGPNASSYSNSSRTYSDYESEEYYQSWAKNNLKDVSSKKKTQGQMSKEQREMMCLLPSIREFSDQEVKEFLNEYKKEA